MNFGDMQTANGVTAVLQNDDDDAVDPHLERIKNQAGGDESDEEVLFLRIHVSILFCASYMSSHLDSHLFIYFYCLQDEDFVVEKDDGGSPTDDSGGDDSDASESGDEKEVSKQGFHVFISFQRKLHYQGF